MASKNSRSVATGTVVEHEGERLTIAEWAARLGTPVQTVMNRINRGWDASRAVSTPATRTPHNKGKKLPPEPLAGHEVQRLLAACSTRSPSGIRSKALIAVLWRGGLRIHEALLLLPRDISDETGVVTIRHGKGDRHRTVRLDAEAMAVLQRWLDRRKALGLNGRQPIFCTLSTSESGDGKLKPGEPLSQQQVGTLLRRLAKRAGIEKRVHAHGLRHSFASDLVEERTFDVKEIQRILGHSSLATTDRYLSRVNPKVTLDKLGARTWPGSPEQPPQ